MTKLNALRKISRNCAKWNGHSLSRFSPAKGHPIGKQVSFANCFECGAMAVVDTQPLPNGIDISGRAVAVGCKKRS